MSINRSVSALILAAACGVSWATPSPVGAWTGKFKLNSNAKATTAAQKAQFQSVRDRMAKMKLLLTLKADHTFTTSVAGAAPKGPAQAGKWSQSGNIVTLTVANSPGDQKFTLGADGKSLKLHLDKNGNTADIIFTR